MNTKLFRLLLAAIAVAMTAMTASPVQAQTVKYYHDTETGLVFQYKPGANTATVIADLTGNNYSYIDEHLEIPMVIIADGNPYRVYEIGEGAFENCKTLKQIEFNGCA